MYFGLQAALVLVGLLPWVGVLAMWRTTLKATVPVGVGLYLPVLG